MVVNGNMEKNIRLNLNKQNKMDRIGKIGNDSMMEMMEGLKGKTLKELIKCLISICARFTNEMEEIRKEIGLIRERVESLELKTNTEREGV